MHANIGAKFNGHRLQEAATDTCRLAQKVVLHLMWHLVLQAAMGHMQGYDGQPWQPMGTHMPATSNLGMSMAPHMAASAGPPWAAGARQPGGPQGMAPQGEPLLS